MAEEGSIYFAVNQKYFQIIGLCESKYLVKMEYEM